VRCLEGFGGEIRGKGPFGRPRRKWRDTIKMVLEEVGWGGLTGFIWLRRGKGGGMF
jgi:hypothetical protein